jgi:hypothetical protein
MRAGLVSRCLGASAILAVSHLAVAPALAGAGLARLTWSDHDWTVTNGAMAGVAPGRPSNVFVDARGFLQLRITRSATTTTAAELFTTDTMGYGTYQWQVDGRVDRMDPAAVLGLFPYGPEAGVGRDGEDELDVEFSKWGHSLCRGHCNADFTFYPSTGNRSLGPAEMDFHASLHGGHVTARLIWSATTVTGIVMAGLVPMGRTTHVLRLWTFTPTDPQARIPNQPLPVGMNLWCFQHATASSQSLVIRSFRFVAAPTS